MIVQPKNDTRPAGLEEVAEDVAKSIAKELLPRPGTTERMNTYTLAERLVFAKIRKIARRAARLGFIAGYQYAIALNGREPTIPYKVKIIFGSE